MPNGRGRIANAGSVRCISLPRATNWRTPEWLFRALNEEFKFDIDVCASAENTQLPVFYDKKTNGLKQQWTGSCWMNPPYGRTIGKWVQKAYVSARRNNAVVVCLIPARTDTKYWHRYCAKPRCGSFRVASGSTTLAPRRSPAQS